MTTFRPPIFDTSTSNKLSNQYAKFSSVPPPFATFARALAEAQEIARVEAKARAVAAGYPGVDNACARCGTPIAIWEGDTCMSCQFRAEMENFSSR